MKRFFGLCVLIVSLPLMGFSQTAADINSLSKFSKTQLMWAVNLRNSYAVKQLLELGADVKLKDGNGMTALHYAVDGIIYDSNNNGLTRSDCPPDYYQPVVKQSFTIMQLLLDAGADVNARNNDGATPFMLASRAGNIEILKAFIARNVDVNAKDNSGRTPLLYAANSHDTNAEIIKTLIEQKTDVNMKDTQGNNALILASSLGRKEIVRVLAESGADVTAVNKNDQAPLNLLASTIQDDASILDFIIKRGADVKHKDDVKKNTPLNNACQQFFPELVIIETLVRAGSDLNTQNTDGDTPLHNAIQRMGNTPNFVEIVKFLVESKADVNIRNKEGDSAMGKLMAQKFDEEVKTDLVKKFVAAGADMKAVDKDGSTPLQSGFMYGSSLETIQLLAGASKKAGLNNEARQSALQMAYNSDSGYIDKTQPDKFLAVLEITNIDPKDGEGGYPPLAWASANGHFKVAKRLIEKGANVNIKMGDKYTDYVSPLSIAAGAGHADIVKLLLSKKANPNIKGYAHAFTPLMMAAKNGHTEAVKCLLDGKADSSAKSRGNGWTALYFAVQSGKLDMIKLLFNSKTDPNMIVDGRPLLCHAAVSGKPELVKFFINAKANVNIKGHGGYTPLALAINCEDVEVVKMLIAAKANVNAKLDDGTSMLSMAKRKESQEVINLIIKSGGK